MFACSTLPLVPPPSSPWAPSAPFPTLQFPLKKVFPDPDLEARHWLDT